MARRRRGRPVHGWVVVDKPAGLTSTQAMARVRRAFDAAKAGHGGTLDPAATGVLPVALGEATKTIPWCQDATKCYRFTLRWGEATATDDAEGEVVATSALRPDEGAVRAALAGFAGEIEQVPPAFSALKVAGRRAYDLARAGEAPRLEARRVHVERLELVEMPDIDHAVFELVCGKGTYVRSLGRDLGRVLGTVAHVARLRRTRVGPFEEAGAISMERLDDPGYRPPPSGWLLPVETALDDIPALAVDAAAAACLVRGQVVEAPGGCNGTVRARLADRLVAIAEVEAGRARPLRVFNMDERRSHDVDHG